MANGLAASSCVAWKRTPSASASATYNSYFDSRQNTIEVYKIYKLQAKKVTQTKAASRGEYNVRDANKQAASGEVRFGIPLLSNP